MKTSSIAVGLLALKASTTSAFTPPSNMGGAIRRDLSVRSDMSSYGDFLGGNNHSRITDALKNILAGDIEGLNEKLNSGLNPDVIMPGGRPILHCLVEQANKNPRDSVIYRKALASLWQAGGDLSIKDSSGKTALAKSTSRAFSNDIKKALIKDSREIPVSQTELNSRLAVFSMQEEPTSKGRELILKLIKQGAEIESETTNGKSIIENIKESWPASFVKRFEVLVSVAHLNNNANRKVKALNSASLDTLWGQAAKGFQGLKAGPSQRDISMLGDISPYGDFLGGNNHSRVTEAFKNIIAGDIEGLNEKLHYGLNPDAIMPGGKPILHCLIEQANKNALDKEACRGTLFLLRMLGGNLQLKDSSGKTVLEKAIDPILSKYISKASKDPINIPASQLDLDYRLALFSMQEEPTAKGKKLITQLVKQGANLNCEVLANGKTIRENIQENWSSSLIEKFDVIVLSARLNSNANRQEKALGTDITSLGVLWGLAERNFEA
jgi:hypothetical protein